MATRTISTKLVLEGENEYKASIKAVNGELRELESELKLVESNFKGNANSLDALTAKGNVLQRMYDEQNEKLSVYAERLEMAKDAQKNAADRSDELVDSIRAQKEVITEYEKALQGSTDGTIELRDANGNLIRSVENGAEEVGKLKTELKEMETALDRSEEEQQKASNTVRDYQTNVNNATVKLNDFDNEVKQNDRYMEEAKSSTDKCATSIDKYGKQAKQAAKETDDLSTKGGLLSKIFSGGFLANIASQALSAVTSTIKQLATEVFAFAGELADLTLQTRLSTDELQELQYVGDGVGLSLDSITGAMTKLISNMDSAREGGKAASDAFQTLGISIYDSVTGELRNSTEVFYEVIDALSMMTNETERDTIAQDLMGKKGTELNTIIAEGSAGMRDLAEAAHEAGAVMSEETINALDEAGDRLAHWKQTLKATLGEAMSDIGNWLAGQDNSVWESIDVLDSMADKIKEVEATYDAAYLTAKKSIDAQMGLWTDLSNEAGKSIGEVGTAIQSQIDWLTNYTVNLDNLRRRNIEGLDELVSSLSDGTKESAAIVSALASASDEQVQVLIGQMQEVEDRKVGLSKQIADVSTDATGQLNAFYEVATEQLDVAEKASVAAQTTIGGYISGALSKIPDVEAAFAQIGIAASRAAQGGVTPLDYSRPAARQPLGAQISQAITGAMGNGILQPISLNLNVSSQLDGRQIARSTYSYNIDETVIRGNNLIN